MWMVVLGLFLSFSAWSQSIPSLFLTWDKEVGCQSYANDPKGDRAGIFIEDIIDGVCIKVCEDSTVNYTLMADLGQISNVQWSVVGGTLTNTNQQVCTVHWGTAGTAALTFVVTTPTGTVTNTVCIQK